MQPNVEKNHPIECKLYVRDLNENSIEAALSYVWGKNPVYNKSITIDGSAFNITTNLYDIIRQLPSPDTPREIWIDAICINQSDPEEKAH